MKNPIKFLKHIVKDPVTTIAEANERKKEIMPLLYGSAGVLVTSLILQVVAKLDFMATFSFIGLAGVAFFAFLLSVISQAKGKFAVLTCGKCNTMAEIKTHEDFVKYISYVVEKDEAIYKGHDPLTSPNKGGNLCAKFRASSSAVVSVYLTCPCCGNVRHLNYTAIPFTCYAARNNINPHEFEFVRSRLEDAVRAVVSDYNDPEKRKHIPYTFHSSKNPNFENRYHFKGANGADAHPDYMGVKIDYHKDVEEILEHYFTLNELKGKLSDPNPAAKKQIPNSKEKLYVSNSLNENMESCEKKADPNQNALNNATRAEACQYPAEEPKTIKEGDVGLFIASNRESVLEEPLDVDLAEKESFKAQKPGHKSYKKTAAVLFAICVALIVGGVSYVLISTNRNQGSMSDETETPLQSTIDPGETSTTTTPVEKINVNDYIGYWHIQENNEKELTIHSGNGDSVIFSLWYYKSKEIKNITAQLQNDIATFSLAVDGAVIKGTLTFSEDAITFHITQSTLAAMPVDVMEFTEQDMTSWVQPEEDASTEPPVTVPEGFKLKLVYTDISLFKEGENYALFQETDGIKPSDITWSVDDPSVATVDQNGRIYAVNRGKTTVRAKFGDQTATCIVRCKFDKVDNGGLKISHTDVTLKVGETFFLTLTDERGVKMNVEWTANVEGFLTIDGSRITCKAASTSTITVSGVYEGVTYTCNIRFKNEVPYKLRVKDDSHGIYTEPSYDSTYVYDLPKGTYTIVAEEYDADNNLWGKLKSGVGWICIDDGCNAA